MIPPVVALLRAHFTILVNGEEQPFEANFSRLMSKVDVYCRFRLGGARHAIHGFVTDRGLRTAGLLCHMLCPSDEGITVIESAFGSWLRVVDAGLSVEHSLPPGHVLETTPHIAYQQTENGSKFFLCRGQYIEDITVACSHGGYALELLLHLYIVTKEEYPERIEPFIQFLVLFVLRKHNPNTWASAPDDLSRIHRVLMQASTSSMWRQLL